MTSLSMSIFLNLSHSPTLVMQNVDAGTSSPMNGLEININIIDSGSN